jgi:hypothetical protein
MKAKQVAEHGAGAMVIANLDYLRNEPLRGGRLHAALPLEGALNPNK